MSENIRKAISVGKLYPSDPLELEKIIENCFFHSVGPGKLPDWNLKESVCCIIVPHGQMSHFGPIAAHAYNRIAGTDIDSIILLGSCQKKNNQLFSIYPSGHWETPLGQVEVDEELCTKIASNFAEAKLDPKPHLEENSIEVQIPFLQFVLKNKFKIVPICIDQEYDSELCNKLSETISKIATGKKILVVAISNLTQNQIYAQTIRKDAIVFERLIKPIATNMIKLYELMKEKQVQVLDYSQLAVLIGIVKKLAANKIEIAKYSTSGQTIGDYSSVVGYCSIVYAKS